MFSQSERGLGFFFAIATRAKGDENEFPSLGVKKPKGSRVESGCVCG